MDKIPYAIYKTETFYELQKDCKKVIWDSTHSFNPLPARTYSRFGVSGDFGADGYPELL